MSFAHQNDGELLAGYITTREPRYFEELFHRHHAAVLHVCRKASGRSDADDVLQAVFVTLARRASELTDAASIAGWLARVAWHTGLRHRRASLTRRRHEQLAAAAAQPAGKGIDAHLCPEIEFELYKALERLPEHYREPLILHHLHGLTVEQCAGLLGSPTGTIAARLSRGREMLRERLKGQGYVVTMVVLTAALERPVTASAAPPEPGSVRPVLACAAGPKGQASGLTAMVYPRLAATTGSAGGAGLVIKVAAALIAGSATLAAGAVAGNYVQERVQEYRIQRAAAAKVKAPPAPDDEVEHDEPDGFFSSSPTFRSGGGSAMPEPAAMSLLAVVATGLLRRRRR